MTPAIVFKEWLGVTPAAGRVLAALHAAGGELVPHADLQAAGGQSRHGMNMSLKLLRSTMDRGAISNVRDAGYHLTRVGLAECERAMADAEGARVSA